MLIKLSISRILFSLLFLFSFVITDAKAQGLLNITGVTFKSSDQSRIAEVIVSNINRKTLVRTDDLGVFRIQAAPGDTLQFSKPLFTSQKIVVNNDNLLSVFLRSTVMLEEVTIRDMSTRSEINATMNNYRRSIPLGSTSPSVLSYVFSPISGLSNLFGRSANNARRFERFAKQEMEDVEIEKRYNKYVVKKILQDISEEELTAFMLAFKPSYEQIKVWADYDIIKYIKQSYDYFVKNRESFKKQNLY